MIFMNFWGREKKTIFSFVFSTYLLVVLLKFQAGVLIRSRIKFRIQWVPTLHTFDGPRYPKNKKYLKKTWWWHHHHIFSGISCFFGSRVHQKYAVWVLVGCGIKFLIQRALPIEIWVKTQWDMSKIRTKKSSFFMIPIPKFILKISLRGAPFLTFKEFLLANTWWHGICIILGRPILNWNFL